MGVFLTCEMRKGELRIFLTREMYTDVKNNNIHTIIIFRELFTAFTRLSGTTPSSTQQ